MPLPTPQQRPSVFDLFADQPFQDKPTWSAGIGEKMRRQLEEMRKRDVEDSAHTASTSSQEQELAKSPRRFNTTSLPNTLPPSEQTWTAGMGNAAKRELLQRRSIMKRNNSSPDIEQEGKAESLYRAGSKSKLQTAEERDESSRGGREYLHQDSLDFHHLEEIPHVSYFCSDAVASVASCNHLELLGNPHIMQILQSVTLMIFIFSLNSVPICVMQGSFTSYTKLYLKLCRFMSLDLSS